MNTFLFSFLLFIVNGVSEKGPPPAYVIAYSSDISGNPEIYITDAEGKLKKKITDYADRDGYPAWSPDGKKITFYAYHGQKTWSIYTMDRNGRKRSRCTFAENKWDNSPTWSPDGQNIAFAREYGNTLEIWIMNADGSNLHQVQQIKGGGPHFTPDGRILFHSEYKDSEICLADIDGKNIIKLTDNEAEDWHPEISPEGKKIVFMSDRDGNYEIYVMDVDGSHQKRLTNHKAGDWEPSWSPDGSQIIFTSDRDGDFDIYIMNNDGSAVKNITNNKAQDLQVSWLKIQK